MSIKIIKEPDEPDVYVTEGELARYCQEYQKAFMFHAGPTPTLEEFIRSQRRSKKKG